MERYCPPGNARFVPANKILPKFKQVHESFLSPKLFSAKVKRFVVISLFYGTRKSVNENENKEKRHVDEFKKYFLQHKPANTKVCFKFENLNLKFEFEM